MSTPTPQSRTPWRYLLWLAWVLAWLAVAAFIVVLAMTAALREPGPLVTLVLAGAAGVVAGAFAFGFGVPEARATGKAAKVAGTVVLAMVVLIGLWSLLGPLAGNGGPTATHALLDGSPAIDAADAALCPPTDQRGVVRPQGAACDVGAFER